MGNMVYTETVDDVTQVLATYRIRELVAEQRRVQDELQSAVRAALSTRAWGIVAAIARETGQSRETLRQLMKTGHADRRPAGVPVAEDEGCSTPNEDHAEVGSSHVRAPHQPGTAGP